MSAIRLLDGGLATRLEAHGHDLSGGLWSARLLLERPSAIEQVHREFFAAGAQVATTASYQASALSLRRAGYDPGLADDLLRRSVAVARSARDATRPDGAVVGSVGAYGASLADGSEYTGRYGLDPRTAVADLAAFHRPRAQALLAAGADELAFETLPTATEVAAAATLIAELRCPAWVSVTPAPGGLTTRDGVPLVDAMAALAGLPLTGAGVNCCPPADVDPALAQIRRALPTVSLVAYPNSGESWDATTQTWRAQPQSGDHLRDWLARGLGHLGGCCRVGPEQIQALAVHLAALRAADRP